MQIVMQTLEQKFEQSDCAKEENLVQIWRLQLAFDCPEQSSATRESIIRWLLGKDLKRFELLDSTEIEIAQQAMAYRYRILRSRYLGLRPEQAYRHLIARLGSMVILQNKIRTAAALSHDCQRSVADVLQEVLQDLLQRDRNLQQEMAWIAECTNNSRLRNILLFASLEEYCLRPIRNRPLLVYRLGNYMRRNSHAVMTQVPKTTSTRLIFAEMFADNATTFSRIDAQAVAQYHDQQALAEQQMLRNQVKQKLSDYLAKKLGSLAVQWLQLYLQGQSQQAIAQILNLPVKEIYRLREKVRYHAARIFA